MRNAMQIAEHVYSTHIEEDPNTFGAMHPGGTQIYFVGDPREHMVVIDSGEPYRSWTKQILDYYSELGKPRISSILVTHGHGDHIGGLDRLQEAMDCTVRCHPKLAPYLVQRLGPDCVSPLRSREVIKSGGGVSLRALFTPGHEDNHVCYFLMQHRTLFSGDTILGNSSSSVRNLKQYMSSLELLAKQKPALICPGHGQLETSHQSLGARLQDRRRHSDRGLRRQPAPEPAGSGCAQRAHPLGKAG